MWVQKTEKVPQTEDSFIDNKSCGIDAASDSNSETIRNCSKCNWTMVNQKIPKIGIYRSLQENSRIRIREACIRFGELSIGRLRTVDEAISFRKKHGFSQINLALFPSSSAPPTRAHEKIMTKVLALPFVDQVWVDVNYKSYTKVGIEHMFKERLEMVKLVVAKKGFDYCTLSKDTMVGETKGGEDIYFKVARALVGDGSLSWVVGGDVVKNMVFWKKRAKENLLQVDRLIVCTRGMTTEAIQEKLLIVFGNKEDFYLFFPRVQYIHTSADISSTVARVALGNVLKVMSPEILTYIISHPNVLDQYNIEFRQAPE